MRVMMRWRLGATETKEAIRSGRMAEINKRLDELTKPEAQYFCTEGGTRTGYIFFDLADPSDIPPHRRATLPRAQRDSRVLSDDGRRSAGRGPRKGVGRLEVTPAGRRGWPASTPISSPSGGRLPPQRPMQ